MPYAFTEHGVLMLAAVLKSKIAIEISMRVIEIFVKMREILSANKDILVKLEILKKRIMGYDIDIQTIFSAVKQLPVATHRNATGSGFEEKMKKANYTGSTIKKPSASEGFKYLFSIHLR